MNSLAINASDDLVWEGCLEYLQKILPENAFSCWIKPLRLLRVDAQTVYLGVMHDTHRNWLEKHYMKDLLHAIQQFREDVEYFRFELLGNRELSSMLGPARVSVDLKTPSAKNLKSNHRQRVKQLEQFRLQYDFNSFVVGDSNRMARSAAQTVAAHPGQNHFNPLVIYGAPGVGKTHLLQAIGRKAVESHTADQVVYRTSDRFIKDFIQAVLSKNFDDFYKIYDQADVLLIDDIQFLAGKEGIQEEMFKLFNRMLSNRKQIVLTCDQQPSEIRKLDQRLLSRLDYGLCCSLNSPDLQTRLSILQAKATQLELDLSQECFCWLASHFQSNVRELEGVLLKLFGFQDLLGGKLNLETIRDLMGDVVRGQRKELNLGSVRDFVAQAYGISSDLLAASTRIQAVMVPRKVAMFLGRELTKASYQSIGLEFQRDYSSVIAAIKSVEKQLQADRSFREQVDLLRRKLTED